MFWMEFVFVIWLAFIIYQDFKYKSITWLLFPLGLAIALVLGLQNTLPLSLIKNTAINYLFLTVQIFLVACYFLFIRKNKISELKKYFGLGDMLFFLIIGIFISPINFIFFLIVSFFAITLGYSVYFLIKGKIEQKKQIPLAGLMSVFFLLLILSDQVFSINIYSDYWILKLMENAG
jgi:hypothetical protein